MAGTSPQKNLITSFIGISPACNLMLNYVRHSVRVSTQPNYSLFDRHLPNRYNSGVSIKLCTFIVMSKKVSYSALVYNEGELFAIH